MDRAERIDAERIERLIDNDGVGAVPSGSKRSTNFYEPKKQR